MKAGKHVADFNELLAALRNPGEDGNPDSIYDDLGAAYTNDTSTRDAKIGMVSDELEALQLELLAAKAANWDLLQQIPVAETEDPGNNEEDDSDDSENNDPEDDSDNPDDDFFE